MRFVNIHLHDKRRGGPDGEVAQQSLRDGLLQRQTVLRRRPQLQQGHDELVALLSEQPAVVGNILQRILDHLHAPDTHEVQLVVLV